jgi:hypothetical protein
LSSSTTKEHNMSRAINRRRIARRNARVGAIAYTTAMTIAMCIVGVTVALSFI